MPLGDPDLGVGHGMRYGRKDQVLVVDLTEPRLVRREWFAGLLEPLAPEAFQHGTSYSGLWVDTLATCPLGQVHGYSILLTLAIMVYH